MDKPKTIWIVHQYASTPEVGMGGRHFYLAQELAKQGYRVYVIAASSHHLLRTQRQFDGAFDIQQVAGFKFVWVKMPPYTEAHSKQRVFNWFLFSWRIQKLARLIQDKPEVVLCSSPSPISFFGAQRLARRFSARLVFEVRDIWPLTLVNIGGYSWGHPFIRMIQWAEDRAYRDSDRVVSNLRNAVEHMIQRGMPREKFFWVANGFSQEEVRKKVPLNPVSASQLPSDKFIVGYTGTFGVANSLDVLIDAAVLLKDCEDITFVLVGHGKEKVSLQHKIKDKGLTNMKIIDAIPKIEVQAMLDRFNVCYIGWRKDELYRFGIAANKIPEYMYAAKPILHSYSGAFDPVAECAAGIVVEAENHQALASAVLKLYQMTEDEKEQMGANGRRAATEQYEYGILAKKLASILFD